MSASDHPGEAPHGLEFPGDHVLIAIGPPGENFQQSVERVLHEAGAVRTATLVSTKVSRTGKYQSVHIEFSIPTREELERLYAVLRAHPEVVYRL